MMTTEQAVLQINNLDEGDTRSPEYKEWDNFMYRIHSVARKEKDSKIMTIIGVAQTNRSIGILDAEKVAIFANRNSISF